MKPLVVVTHDGTFHTDDVFACAVLSLQFVDRKIEIIRTREEHIFVSADIVVDVGGVYDTQVLRFDHHQKGGADSRANGIPYASFGLVWKEYGVLLSGSIESAQFIDEQLVQGIDGADNGVVNKVSDNGIYSYSVIDCISAIRPTWEETKDMDEAFMEAVEMAKTIVVRMIAHSKGYSNARVLLERAYEESSDKTVIDIKQEYPGWYEVMASYPEPLYVVYERSDGSWSAKAVRTNPVEFTARKAFPESWAGLKDQELQIITGVADALFCHNGRFIAVAKTRDGALTLAQKASVV